MFDKIIKIIVIYSVFYKEKKIPGNGFSWITPTFTGKSAKDFWLICQTKKSENPEHVMHLGKEKVGFFFQIGIRQSNKA